MSLIEKAADKMKKSESLIERAAKKMKETSSQEVASDNSQADIKADIGKSVKTAPQTKSFADSVIEKKESKKSTDRKAEHKVHLDMENMRRNNILTADTENSVVAEEFRIVKRSLLLNAFAKGDAEIENGNIIMVTSSQPNEGKTFCSLSLAMSMATERDLTVMLVDADVAKPDILKTLGVKAGKGLIDVIENKDLDLRDCLIRTNIDNFTILPAGKKHNLTTELLASERMGEIIDEIAQRYNDRVIIIDSPPVLASSAASVLALHVGQVLFVVEAEKTGETELKESLDMISACKNINLVLNKSRFSGGKKKFGSYYGYGYN